MFHVFNVGVLLLATSVVYGYQLDIRTVINNCGLLKYYGSSANGPNLTIALYSFGLGKSSFGRNQYGVCKFFGNNGSFVEAFNNSTQEWQHVIAYDFNHKNFYWFDDKKLYKGNAYGNKEALAELNIETAEIQGVAVDWVTDNLYFSISQVGMGVLNLNKPKIMIENLVNYKGQCDDNDPKLFKNNIFIHPNKGFLFFQYCNSIFRSNLDGSSLTKVRYPLNEYDWRTGRDPTFLLDYYNDKLYWSTPHSRIFHSELTGSDVTELCLDRDNNNYHTYHYNIVSVDAKYLYYQYNMMEKVFIRRANKLTGLIDSEFRIDNVDPKIMNYINQYPIFAPSDRPYEPREDHPCRVQNGGCAGLCLAYPGADGKLEKRCRD